MNYTKYISQIGLVVALTAITAVGCGNNNAQEDDHNDGQTTVQEDVQAVVESSVEKGDYELKGTITGSPAPLVYLQRFQNGQLVFADTTRTDEKGNYVFKGQEGEPTFYYVTLNSSQPPGVPVLLQAGEKLRLDIDAGIFYETKVKGGSENQHLKELFDLYMSHNKKSKIFTDKVQQLDGNNLSDSMKMALNLEYNALGQNQQKDVEEFVAKKKGTLASYFAVTYVIQEPSMDLLDRALEGLQSAQPSSMYTTELNNRIQSVKPLEIGGQAPDIALTSPDGQVVKLSSLRGKYVLIDFWASWCRPCRAENPNVVRMYQKYHDKGFEIYSVSLDNNAANWKGAIEKDGLTWTHVSDLRGWQSSAAALYKVSSIPQTFLLDQKGRIMAKNLRGNQLEAKLAEIFN